LPIRGELYFEFASHRPAAYAHHERAAIARMRERIKRSPSPPGKLAGSRLALQKTATCMPIGNHMPFIVRWPVAGRTYGAIAAATMPNYTSGSFRGRIRKNSDQLNSCGFSYYCTQSACLCQCLCCPPSRVVSIL